MPLRYDSIRWDCSNTSVMIPNNFPYVAHGTPQVIPDSINIRTARMLRGIPFPKLYFYNTRHLYDNPYGISKLPVKVVGMRKHIHSLLQYHHRPLPLSTPYFQAVILNLHSLLKQRRRWYQGYLSFLVGVWRPGQRRFNNSSVKTRHLFTGPATLPSGLWILQRLAVWVILH